MMMTAHIPCVPPDGGARCRDSTLPGVIALALTAPLAYEANPGIVQGVAPRGTTAVRVLADGRSVRVLRLTSGRRAFLLGPIGLPPRDLTLTVAGADGPARARLDDGRPRLRPAGGGGHGGAAAHDRRAAATARRQRCRLARACTSAAWVRDLGTRQHRRLQRRRALPGGEHDQARDPARRARARRHRPRALVVVDARARARAELVQPRRQRAAAARGRSLRRSTQWRAGSARPRRFTCCGYLLEAGERAIEPARRARPLPPTTVVDQPTFPCCKYTTAHDLGTLLVSLTLAAIGPRAGAAPGHHGARGARGAVAARARELPGARATVGRLPGRPQGGLAAATSSTTPRSCSRPAARSSRSS